MICAYKEKLTAGPQTNKDIINTFICGVEKTLISNNKATSIIAQIISI
jgi:hypothetical protein